MRIFALLALGVLGGVARAEDREILRTPKAHDGVVYAAEFSADGRRILTYGADNTAGLWDAASGKELACFYHPPAKTGVLGDAKLALARLSPDGSRVLTVTANEYRHDWDATPGSGGHLGGNDPRNDAARLWDTATGKVIAEWVCDADYIAALHPVGPAFSPDSRLVAVTFGSQIDTTVHVRDAVTGKPRFRLVGHTQPVIEVAFSADGKRIATASADQTTRVWDTATGKCTHTLKGHVAGIVGVAFSPDGNRLVTTSAGRTYRFQRTPNGSSGGSGSADDVIARVWDLGTGKETLALAWGPLPGTPVKRELNLGPLGLRIETKGIDNVKGFVRTARFTADGRGILTAGVTGDVWGQDERHPTIWDAATGKRLVAFKGEEFGDVAAVSLSPHGKLVAAGGKAGPVRVWEAATGKELLVFQGHAKPVRTVAFNHDNTRLLTTSDDGTARVWNIVGP